MERLTSLMSRAYISDLDITKVKQLKTSVPAAVLNLIEDEIYQLSPDLNVFNIFNADVLKLSLNKFYAHKSSFIISPNGKYILVSGRSDYINDVLYFLKDATIDYKTPTLDYHSLLPTPSPSPNTNHIFSHDSSSIIYTYRLQYTVTYRQQYYVYNIETSINAAIPFLIGSYNLTRIGNLLLFLSYDPGTTQGVARWEKGKITLIQHIDQSLGQLFDILDFPDNVNCESLVLALLDSEFKTIIENNVFSSRKPLFSSDCKLIVALNHDRLKIIKVSPDELLMNDLDMPVNYRYSMDLDIFNCILTKDNKFILWSNQIIYLYDLNIDSNWKSIVKLSGNDGILLVEAHRGGLLIQWSNYIRFDSIGNFLLDGKVSDVTDHGKVIGSPLIMPPYFGSTEELISNYDFSSQQITFHLEISNGNWMIPGAKASLIENDLVFYRTFGDPLKFYDSSGKLVPYGFNIGYSRANTLMIDTVKSQFRLLSETFYNSEDTNIQYYSDRDGMYVAYSWGEDPRNDEINILPKVIYYDRRISFLRRFANYKNMLIERNIPLPTVYPNNMILKQLLQLYGQMPYEIYQYDLDSGVMNEYEFKEIIQKFF